MSELAIDGATVLAVAPEDTWTVAALPADVAWYGLEASARRGVAWSAGS